MFSSLPKSQSFYYSDIVNTAILKSVLDGASRGLVLFSLVYLGFHHVSLCACGYFACGMFLKKFASIGKGL